MGLHGSRGAPLSDLTSHDAKCSERCLIVSIGDCPRWRPNLFAVTGLARSNDALYRFPPARIPRLLFNGRRHDHKFSPALRS